MNTWPWRSSRNVSSRMYRTIGVSSLMLGTALLSSTVFMHLPIASYKPVDISKASKSSRGYGGQLNAEDPAKGE